MYKIMSLYRVTYDYSLYELDFNAYSEHHAVQQFTELCLSLNWGFVNIEKVSLLSKGYFEIETP